MSMLIHGTRLRNVRIADTSNARTGKANRGLFAKNVVFNTTQTSMLLKTFVRTTLLPGVHPSEAGRRQPAYRGAPRAPTSHQLKLVVVDFSSFLFSLLVQLCKFLSKNTARNKPHSCLGPHMNWLAPYNIPTYSRRSWICDE